MSHSKKWKSGLVSSSLPLEFEIAKLLTSNGFSITADYTYERNDSGVLKDFSVDIRAVLPVPDENKVDLTVVLLIECKQRRPNVNWLFLPDPNDPNYSPVTIGRTLRAVDKFSTEFLPPNSTIRFDRSKPHSYKGVEIDIENGRVYDAELQHGVSQLQFALPRLLTEEILFNWSQQPFLICPVLLTTSSLFMAQGTLDSRQVEQSQRLTDIATAVPNLILFSGYGPDFERHCQLTCASLKRIKSGNPLDKKRTNHGEYDFNLPSKIATGLSESNRTQLYSYFTQFVVCNDSHLDSLISQIRNIALEAAKSLSPERIPIQP